MKLSITNHKKISEIKSEFHTLFPYLKIAFYHHIHQEGQGSQKQDEIDSDLNFFDVKKTSVDKTIDVTGSMTVTEFEVAFADTFEIGAQVFRKSGNIYLQTTTTDHLTLDEQNQKAAAWFADNEKEEIINAMDRQDLE